jgi:hypothetical protein
VAENTANVADAPALRFEGGHYGQPRFPVGHPPSPLARHRGSSGYGGNRTGRGQPYRPGQVPALTPEAPPLNVCAATARRLLEIAQRNEIRREAKLPLLPIAKELRRMKEQERLEEFERFEATYVKAVWEEVLKDRREAEGNPNWRPTWIEGVRYQNEVYKILRDQFHAARRAGSGRVLINVPHPMSANGKNRHRADTPRMSLINPSGTSRRRS